ncbi:BglG family transcription antiterminator [Enterococcus wangshanyuanii]|uniref:PTS fructose transporter subunit IIA n=1 Tax=Enterococcus wangshanyuanii TaxID=2005703 RepID=A0ABQ1NQ58_9ENTE|nr:PTS sugar transporter subunit IIA [Enterococcus wangshanyuanii]GGC80197.1 PTS fructose transporter subunit IIA [Enterococcus wangshanyuanii]
MKLTKRENQLLELLLLQNEYQATTFFGSQLSVSNKTIYSDLKNIQEYLEKTNLKIERMPRKGIYLVGSEENKEQLKSLLSRESITVLEDETFSPAYRQLTILSDILLYENRMTYDHYAVQFLISKQSIKKDMDEVIDYLESNGVTAGVNRDSSKNEKETKIQKVYKKYLISYSKKYHPYAETDQRDNLTYFSAIIDPQIVYQVNLFIEKLMIHTGKVLNNYFVYSLRLSLSILLIRLKSGHHVEKQNEFVFKDLQKMQLYMIALAFSEEMNQELKCIFFKHDIQFLCSLLLAHGVVPGAADLPIDQKIHETTLALIEEMAHLLNVTVDQDQQLYQSLISHIIPMIHRLENDIYVRNPLKNNIKKQYTTMFTLTQFASAVFEKKYGLFLNEDEVSFLTIHFQVAFEKIQSTKHVLIVCGNGLATSELIFNRIKQNLPASVVVEIATEKQVMENPIDDIDLIISAIPLEQTSLPIIHVSALPTADEVAMIATYLSNMSEHEKTLMYSKKKNSVSVDAFIQEELIFLNMTLKKKEEILDHLIEQYEKLGFVEKGFKESIFQREALGDTSIISGAAIPHGAPETVKETRLSFMTTKNPVRWGANDVRLIITIAIAEKDLAIAKDLVSVLYDIIDSAENVQEIIKSQSAAELMAYVKRRTAEDVF